MAVKEEEKAAVSDERQKALKLAIDKIEKDFGKGAIKRRDDDKGDEHRDAEALYIDKHRQQHSVGVCLYHHDIAFHRGTVCQRHRFGVPGLYV